MSCHPININQLTNIQSTYYLRIHARECARRMKIGKDKAYTYYRLFQKGLSVEEIYAQYKQNKRHCGRKPLTLSKRKLDSIHDALDQGWSLDAMAGRDKLMNHEERVSTKTLYKFVKIGLIDAKKRRRKGKNNSKNHQETRGKINECNTIHERHKRYPQSETSQEYGHVEGDMIVGKNRQSVIMTLIEKKSKYIILFKASRKSQDVNEATLNGLNQLNSHAIKTITFDRGKVFSKWQEIEHKSKIDLEIFFSDPGSPGQGGLNENLDRIVRQDLPKSTDLSVYTQEGLNNIEMKDNRVPRRSLDDYTPEEMMKKATGLDSPIPIV